MNDQNSARIAGDQPQTSAAPSPILLLTLAVATTAFRFIAIGQESFWSDEVWSLYAVRGDFWGHILGSESTPPLHFALLKLWSMVFGQGHVALRGFAAVAGGLCVPALLWAGWRWGLDRASAIVAAAILFFHPFAFWSSQQNRYYSLLMLFGILFLGACSALRTKEPRRVCWPVAVLGFLGMATHYYFVFLLVPVGLWFVADWWCRGRDRRSAKLLLTTAVVLGVLCLTLLPILLKQRENTPASFLNPPNWDAFLNVFRVAFWFGPKTAAGWGGWRLWLLLLALAMAVVGVIVSTRRRDFERLRTLALFATVGLGGPILSAIVSHGALPIFIMDRYMVLFLPMWILLLVGAWGSIRGSLIVGAAAWVAVAVPTLHNYITVLNDYDWRSTIRIVESQLQEGDTLLFCPGWASANFLDNGGNVELVASHGIYQGPGHPGNVWLVRWKGAPEGDGCGLLWEALSHRETTVLQENLVFALTHHAPSP